MNIDTDSQTVLTIVCLANSRKLAGRCVAGKSLDCEHAGFWIRPVSNREHEEVSEHERQYKDGSDPKVLDIIEIPLLGPNPHGFQQENWLLDPKFYWTRMGQLPVADLARLTDTPASLWLNGYSTGNGHNDRVPLAEALRLQSSLALIEVDDLELHVFAPGEAFGNSKRRVQAQFTYNRERYELWVTDPKIERPYLRQDDGYYQLGKRHLCVSLGEPHEGYCYKLVASII